MVSAAAKYEFIIVSNETIMNQPKRSIYYHKFATYKLDNCIWPLYVHFTKDHYVVQDLPFYFVGRDFTTARCLDAENFNKCLAI